jgi:hypothetical protein
MFVKPSSALFLLLSASKLVSASLTVQIGYYAGLVPGLPGPEPSLGCGLWAQATDGTDTVTADFVGTDSQPSDSCPGADVVLFCSRWACPYTMTFGGVLGVVVNSDNSDDQSISIEAATPEGGSTTVTCPWTSETIYSSDSGSLYSTWSCDVSAVQG